MSLTSAQLATLKADIAANSDLNVFPNTADGAVAIANLYNLLASPAFWVWNTSVSFQTVSNQILSTDVANLTTANSTRLQVLLQLNPVTYDFSVADKRAMFPAVFTLGSMSGTVNALAAIYARQATRVEKLFANTSGGNGATNATAATATFQGTLTYQDVLQARSN